MPQPSLLAGTRVLDLSQGIAGPSSTRILAAFGADVLKVERPAGDPLRHYDPLGVRSEGSSELFEYLNGGKRGLTLDLATAAGQSHLDRLLAATDIVVESYLPSVAARLDLTPARVARANPAAVLLSIRNFAPEGPSAEHRANHLVVMAASGYVHQHGIAGREPMLAGMDLGLHFAGVMAAVYALAALRARHETGAGAALDLPLTHALNWMQPAPLAHVAIRGQHMWPRNSNSPPGILRCADGWIGANVLTGQHWQDLMCLVGRPDLALRDDWLANPALRLEAAQEWVPPVAEWVRQRTAEECFAGAQAMRIPFGRVAEVSTMLGDEQHRARDFFVPQDIAGQTVEVPGAPFHASETAWVTPTPAPAPGASGDPDWSPRPAVGPTGRSLSRPLDGIRVLELGAWWSACAGATALAALGADVIKLESPQMDGWRLTVAPPGSERIWERSPMFVGWNFGKRGIVLDLATPRGKELFLDLVEQSDVVLANFSPRVMPNLGLGFQDLARRNPRLVMASISGYGATGPQRDSVAHGVGFEQASGVASVTGYRDEGQPRCLNAYTDAVVGQWAAAAILGALEYRRRTGRGQWLDISACQCLATFFGGALAAYQLRGVAPERLGNRHAGMVPHNIYPALGGDAWVAVSACSDAEWQALATAMGNPPWAADPELATLIGRKRREDEIDAHIAAWTSTRCHYDIERLLQAAGIHAAAVLSPSDQPTDPNLSASHHFQVLDRDPVGPIPYPRLPARFDGRPLDILRPAPRFGEHTREILRSLAHLTDAEIDGLYAAGVTTSTPAGYA